MPVSREDLAALVVGSLFVAIGAVAAAAALSTRPRVNRSAAWFGVFCLLYGVRLGADSALVQAGTRAPATLFNYIDAFVTYAILVPATLFVDSVIGPGAYALLRRTSQALTIYAAGAILTDLMTGRPYAAMRLNAPIVVITAAIGFAHLAVRARRGRWSAEGIGVAVAAAIFALTAIYETIAGRGLFGQVDAEPLAMLVLTAALGWLVLVRTREQAFSYAALSRELELARTIQQSLLPQRMPDVPGLRLTGAYLPMGAVAGDFYEVLPLSGGRTLVLVADVSGHGIPAALIASMVKVAVAVEADRYDRPGEILGGINRALTGKFERAFVTACCVVVDRPRLTLTYGSAGHPPPLLRRASGRIEPLDQGGIALTFAPSARYATIDVAFEPGDRLLMYTDGLTEAPRAGGGEFFGDAELARVVGSTPASADLTRVVLEAHRLWVGDDTPLSDDISIVVIENVEHQLR